MNDLVHLRLEKKLKEHIRNIVDTGLFSNMTEFIKDSIRKNIEDYNKKLVLMKIRKLQYSAKLLTEKEKQKRNKELDSMTASDIFRKFGLNE